MALGRLGQVGWAGTGTAPGPGEAGTDILPVLAEGYIETGLVPGRPCIEAVLEPGEACTETVPVLEEGYIGTVPALAATGSGIVPAGVAVDKLAVLVPGHIAAVRAEVHSSVVLVAHMNAVLGPSLGDTQRGSELEDTSAAAAYSWPQNRFVDCIELSYLVGTRSLKMGSYHD
jgi:hypothetical protein